VTASVAAGPEMNRISFSSANGAICTATPGRGRWLWFWAEWGGPRQGPVGRGGLFCFDPGDDRLSRRGHYHGPRELDDRVRNGDGYGLAGLGTLHLRPSGGAFVSEAAIRPGTIQDSRGQDAEARTSREIMNRGTMNVE
jgi:hypothetical protein